MALESLRAALQLVSGASELTRAKAVEAAGSLLALPGVGPQAERATVVASQVSSLADELVAAATANRELVRDLVRQELATQLKKVGLSTNSESLAARDEIDRLTAEIADLRASLGERAGAASAARSATADADGSKGSAKSTAARKPGTSKAAAKKSVAKKTVANKSGLAESTPAKSTTAKTTPAKTTAAKASASKSGAAKAAATKRPATRTTATKSSANETQANNRSVQEAHS